MFTEKDTPFIPGKANIMRDGDDVAIFSMGLMIPEALKAADILKDQGVNAAVVNFHTVKPFDNDCAVKMAKKCGAVVTAEEHSVIGGLGSATAEALMGQVDARFARVGIQDKFGKSGKPEVLFEQYGLTADNIVKNCKALINK
jgi:transketolase